MNFRSVLLKFICLWLELKFSLKFTFLDFPFCKIYYMSLSFSSGFTTY